MTNEERAINHIKDIICENNTVRHSDMVVFEEEKKALYKALQALEQLQWIPVSERLPEERQDVLACFYNGEGNYKMMVSRRTDYNYWSGVGRTADMVAWMPLPTPYEPQERSE